MPHLQGSGERRGSQPCAGDNNTEKDLLLPPLLPLLLMPAVLLVCIIMFVS